eukprot:TRINITY_DN191_c1_g1_i9.p1 TRINITY_DN191_c1_g1~~TRINITY_DN191_c1_g1_i9.p1  ORF type:complete len:300 (+),score=30.85 TRINITY_DN191_c1_g1_i9:194-1093(+)
MWWLWLCLCFVTDTIATSPQVTSAKYVPKSYMVEGYEYKYTTFEVDWDQEIYYVDNWPCPCLRNETFKSLRTVDERGYDLTTLKKDLTVRQQVSSSTSAWFKFEIKEEDYPSGPPALRIFVDTSKGSVLTTIATESVPTETNYHWIKSPSSAPTFGICPTYNGYGFGWYYVLASSGESSEFTISWSTVDTPICKGPPTPKSSTRFYVLENNKAIIPDSPTGNFRFDVEHLCTNFSISFQTSLLTKAPLITLFLDGKNGTNLLFFQFVYSRYLGSNSISVANVCSPTGVVPWSLVTILSL